MNELTKSEKRKCRELIQLGLNRECAKFVEQIRNLSQTTSEDPHAQYIGLFCKIGHGHRDETRRICRLSAA